MLSSCFQLRPGKAYAQIAAFLPRSRTAILPVRTHYDDWPTAMDWPLA